MLLNYLSDIWNSLVNVIFSMTFVDVLDIFFLAIILYWVIKLVRETRAEQLMKGLVFADGLKHQLVRNVFAVGVGKFQLTFRVLDQGKGAMTDNGLIINVPIVLSHNQAEPIFSLMFRQDKMARNGYVLLYVKLR